MIYTLTLNPAIDYVVALDNLEIGKINRSENENIYFGGKGINVSLILSELGFESVATGFVAGFTGEALAKGISCDTIKSDFVKLKNGITRINVKIRHGGETDINSSGPMIDENDINELFEKLENISNEDWLILSGSVPSNLPQDIYEKIMQRLKPKGVRFVVDAQGGLLLSTLKYNPFLIKPNADELGEIFSVEIKNNEDAVRYAKELRKMGAQNVLVSLGKDGAVLSDEKDNIYYLSACKGDAVDTVGAGDSMLAGFIAGYLLNADYNYALRLATACGGATAFSQGLAKRENIESLMEQLA